MTLVVELGNIHGCLSKLRKYSTDHVEIKRSCVYYVNHSRALIISTSTGAVLRVRVRIMSRTQLSCEYESTRTRGRPNECRTSEGKLYEHGTLKNILTQQSTLLLNFSQLLHMY